MDRVANSTPMVDFESRLNSFRVNRLNRLDFPTPESPISTTVNHGGVSFLNRVTGQSRGGRQESWAGGRLEGRDVCTLEKKLVRSSRSAECTRRGSKQARRAGDGEAHIVLVVGHCREGSGDVGRGLSGGVWSGEKW